MTTFKFNPGDIEIEIDLELYSFDVIHKCFYWYTREFIIEITNRKDNIAQVKLILKAGELSLSDFESKKNRISNDLLDHKTRDIVSKETQNIRDLLIAKAFSHTDEFDNLPPGDFKAK